MSAPGTRAHWMRLGATSNRPKAFRWPAWSLLSSISSTDGWKRTTRFVDTHGIRITASTVTTPRSWLLSTWRTGCRGDAARDQALRNQHSAQVLHPDRRRDARLFG